MSRDFKPIETFSLSSEEMLEQFESMVWHIGDKEVPIYNKEQIEKHHKYLYLSWSCISMVDKLDDEKCGYLEDCIRSLIDEGVNKDETVSKWFYGNLDEHFYSREENNELLIDYLESENYIKIGYSL